MQRITFFIALFLGLSFQPLQVFARDQGPDPDKKDAKEAGTSPHSAKANHQIASHGQNLSRPRAASEDKTFANKTSNANGFDAAQQGGSGKHHGSANVNSGANSQSVQQTSQRYSQRNQNTTITTIQGNRGNRYNGNWVAGNTHGDWDRSRNHAWNNRNYRWYDGGWLIIDTSESPSYYQTGSIVIQVKQSLAQQGYYNGHFSETVGPHTRQAISNYESDNGLQINGRIDGPLLASLGLR